MTTDVKLAKSTRLLALKIVDIMEKHSFTIAVPAQVIALAWTLVALAEKGQARRTQTEKGEREMIVDLKEVIAEKLANDARSLALEIVHLLDEHSFAITVPAQIIALASALAVLAGGDESTLEQSMNLVCGQLQKMGYQILHANGEKGNGHADA